MRHPLPAGMPVPGDPGLHLEVTTDLPPGAWLIGGANAYRKAWPGIEKTAAERREARRPTSLAGDL